MSPKKKFCMVCGDKAMGYNFNAVTCESCKAFFRRNALLDKKFKCPFNENCEVTAITRRFCQKCRLEKCFKIGMKKEHIMSEEDKILKKKKIELNRAKRKLTSENNEETEIKQNNNNNNKYEATNDNDYDLCPEKIKRNSESSNERESISSSKSINLSSESIKKTDVINNVQNLNGFEIESNVKLYSCAEEIVNAIMNKPETASQVINKVMKTPEITLDILSKIINSPTEAMKLISHLIIYPGDALNIISKIMNSPLDALTVFTKFMSSPTDTLQIITRIVNSPSDVLDFIRQLMCSPEDAINIMEKFMNTPAEALRIINSMVNKTFKSKETENEIEYITVKNSVINSMLNEVQSPEPLLSSSSSPEVNANHKNSNISVSTQILTPSIKTTTLNPNNFSIDNHLNTNDSKPNFSSFSDITYSTSTKSEQLRNIFEDVEDRPILPNSIESVLCEAIKLEYETYSTIPQTLSDSKELNETEKAKLYELIQASKALYLPVDEDLSNLINDERIKCEGSQQDPKLLHLINLTAVAIRRLIKMSKKISAFKNMCQEDQIALLKGGCTEMMIMRSVMTYDQNKAMWKIPHSKEDMSNIKVDVLKLAKGKVYEEHDRFIRTFEPKWRMDENIILIMCAILLFSPMRPRVIHSDVIKLEQNSYYYLLRRYLESVYPGCEAKSTFIKLIQKISEVTKLNEVIISVYLNVNPSHIEPLLREIFDLKNH